MLDKSIVKRILWKYPSWVSAIAPDWQDRTVSKGETDAKTHDYRHDGAGRVWPST
jgi:hypothetical protein